MIPVFRMELGAASPRARGRQIGETCRVAIADARRRLRAETEVTGGVDEGDALARMDDRHPELAAELTGMAEGAGCTPSELLQLQAAADGRAHVAPGCGLTTALHVHGAGGSMIAGAVNGGLLSWGVVLTSHCVDDHTIVALRSLGGLAWAGVNSRGLGVMAAHPPWGARVLEADGWQITLRRALRQHDVASARATLKAATRRGGRYWLISDGADSEGIESSPSLFAVTRRGARVAHVHTDHYFDAGLRARAGVEVSPRSYRRMELASSMYVQRQPENVEALFDFFDALDHTHGATGDEKVEDNDASVLGVSVKFVAQCGTRTLHVSSGESASHLPTRMVAASQ